MCETADAVPLLRVHNFLTPTFGRVGIKGDDVEARERLLTPGEVASLSRAAPKPVTRGAAAGRISSIRTPGGHRRFRESEVRALLRGEDSMAATPAPRQSVEDERTARS